MKKINAFFERLLEPLIVRIIVMWILIVTAIVVGGFLYDIVKYQMMIRLL